MRATTRLAALAAAKDRIAVSDLVRLEWRASVREGSQEGGNAEVVPQGTQLVGVWEALPPVEEGRCAVHVNGTPWTADRDNVIVTRLDPATVPWKEQERIANAHLAQAKEASRQGKDEEARQHYGRALVELEASGKSAIEITAERLLYAFLLAKQGHAALIAELLQEFADTKSDAVRQRAQRLRKQMDQNKYAQIS